MSPVRRALLVSLLLAAGCGKDPIAKPDLRVDKLPAGGGGCYITCQEHPPELAGSPPLGQVCPTSLGVDPTCGFAGGADRIRVVADLGEIEVDRQQTITDPSVFWLQDGASTPAPGVRDRSEDGTRMFYTAFLDAPKDEVRNLGVRVEFSKSFFNEVDGFDVEAPVPRLLASCKEEKCLLAGEKVQAVIEAPLGLVGQTATVQTEVGGFLSETHQDQLLTKGVAKDNGTTPVATATFWVDTPAAIASPNDQLLIHGCVGSFVTNTATFDLQAPEIVIDSVVGCTGENGECLLGVDKVEVTVKAPAGMAGKTASIKTYVDGAPDASWDNLMFKPVGNDAIARTTPQSVPAKGEKWILEGTVGAFTSPQHDVAVSPPPLTPYVEGCRDIADPCEAHLSVDKIIVVVEADKALAGQQVTVTAVVDEVSQPSVPVTLVPKDGHAVGKLPVGPLESGKEVRWRVSYKSFPEKETLTVKLDPPEIHLQVTGCQPNAECPRSANVGSLLVQVTAPVQLAAPGKQAIVTGTLDGVPQADQPGAFTVVTKPDGTAEAVATVAVPVPDAPCDTGVDCKLTIAARVGTFYAVEAQIVKLATPKLLVDVPGCPAPCKRTGGQIVMFIIYAPVDIRTHVVGLTPFLNDSPYGDSASAGMESVFNICPFPEVGASCRYVLKSLTVPADASAVGKLWSLHAQVGFASVTSGDVEVLAP